MDFRSGFSRWRPHVAGLAVALAATTAHAYEPGYPGWSMPPGAVQGATAAAAPVPGFYSTNQFYIQQTNSTGPGTDKGSTRVNVATFVTALLWSPGLGVLGGTYEAMLVQPFTMADAGAPINSTKAGMHNTVLVPGQISWKLGDSGFYVKSGLAVVVPDGTINGANGLGNIGNPWWIIQPSLIVSYLKDDWKVTVNTSMEFNTANTESGYRTGNILHADFTALRTFGKWSVGPIVTYIGQVSNDTSSAFYHNVISTNRYNLLALGGMVTYDFGPVKLSAWATKDVLATATGGPTGPDTATITKGYHVFANVAFKF